MKNIKIKYDSWEKITVEKFQEIKNLTFDKVIDEAEIFNINIKLLSIMTDEDEDTISDLPLNYFAELIKKLDFLKKLPVEEIKDTYIINGKKYNVFTNLKKITTAQYIDFQTLQKDYEKNLKYLLAVFIIPDGKNYGDYDVDEVADDIYTHMRITAANSVMFFFLLQYRALTLTILNYSIRKMKKEMKKEKMKIIKIKIGRAIIAMKNMLMIFHKNGAGYIM